MNKSFEQITDEAMTAIARDLSPELVEIIQTFIRSGLTRKEIMNIFLAAPKMTDFMAAMIESIVEELILETESLIPC